MPKYVNPGAQEAFQEKQAENAAMERRMVQARKHISGLMQRLAALEIEP